ncbi:MAG: MFS transporter, partial [Oscillospiraceae bacterium]|nr:MFS transporter [Oscillospiraceae bacterium]
MARQKKELGLDSMGIQKTMRFKDYFGDGIGQLPLNVMSTLVGQLTYFYTEKVGLAAGAVATMLLIAKICDALSDMLMGKIIDKVNSPKVKCRPWFLWMLAPTVAIIILMFTVPKNAASGVQMGYVLITNILISAVIYTAIAIPYGSIMAVRTESVEERGKMGIARTVFGYLIGMV